MIKFSSAIKSMLTWIKKNKVEFVVILAIVLIGAFLRLYRISEYMTFLGDEGRDAIVIRKLLVYADPILVGPGTSIGNMYLGPLYYYLIAPSLLVANFSPAGPSIFVALIGVLTIGFIYKITREWFGKLAASSAAVLYALSPTVIIYSRSSWNPNVMPFFALLCIYALWKVWQERKYLWLIVLGISYAFVLNSHYLGLVLAPVLGIFWLMAFLKERKQKTFRKFLVNSLLGGCVFLFLMSPLVIFDARHGWRNFSSIKTFFTQRETTVSVKPWKALPNSWPLYNQFMTRLITGRNERVGEYMAIASVVGIVILVLGRFKSISAPKRYAYILLFSWIISALVGLGLYKQHIYDHYFGFFFPALFILTGALLSEIVNTKKKILLVITLLILGGLVYINILDLPIKYAPNRQLQRSEEVAQKVIEMSQGERFNFALIAQQNYEAGYRYFLDLEKANVVDIDPQNGTATITKQLIVVCEMEKSKCDPTHNPKSEVANFGWSKIESETEVSGVTIYKLIHTQ